STEGLRDGVGGAAGGGRASSWRRRREFQGSQHRRTDRLRPYGGAMGELIPLFPLGTPLFPGTVLPLQIFEPRYRRLLRDLLSLPEGGDRPFFGVVAFL